MNSYFAKAPFHFLPHLRVFLFFLSTSLASSSLPTVSSRKHSWVPLASGHLTDSGQIPYPRSYITTWIRVSSWVWWLKHMDHWLVVPVLIRMDTWGHCQAEKNEFLIVIRLQANTWMFWRKIHWYVVIPSWKKELWSTMLPPPWFTMGYHVLLAIYVCVFGAKYILWNCSYQTITHFARVWGWFSYSPGLWRIKEILDPCRNDYPHCLAHFAPKIRS